MNFYSKKAHILFWFDIYKEIDIEQNAVFVYVLSIYINYQIYITPQNYIYLFWSFVYF